MQPTYARFAASPIGDGLAARDGGLTVNTTAATTLHAHARSDVVHGAGNAGVEFAFWGDAALAAQIGIVPDWAGVPDSVARKFPTRHHVRI